MEKTHNSHFLKYKFSCAIFVTVRRNDFTLKGVKRQFLRPSRYENFILGSGISGYSLGEDLPMDHFAHLAAKLPVHTNLLQLYAGGSQSLGAFQGNMAWIKKDCKLPSMGWTRP
jgi:hypothetical protein